MRESVYLVLTLASAGPALGFESSPKIEAGIVQRVYAPARLDLQTPVFKAATATVALSAFHGTSADCLMVCARASLTTPLPPLDAVRDRAVSPLAGAAPSAIAWALPAGLSVLAAGTLGQTTLSSQPAWPLGATVPSMKASAAVALDLSDIAGSPFRVGLSVNRAWQLDGPIGGTYPDCVLRLDIAAEVAPGISLQAPCGPVEQFTVGLRGRF